MKQTLAVLTFGITVIMSRLLAHTDWQFTFQRPVGEVIQILDLDASLSYLVNEESLTLIPQDDDGAYSVYVVSASIPITVRVIGPEECLSVQVEKGGQ